MVHMSAHRWALRSRSDPVLGRQDEGDDIVSRLQDQPELH